MADDQNNTAREIAGWAIATNFAFTVAGGALLGWLLERYVWPKSTPWLILSGAIAGLIGGGYRFIAEALAVSRAASGTKKFRPRR